jgi:selenocysteine lyase/cysteine desulfurase
MLPAIGSAAVSAAPPAKGALLPRHELGMLPGLIHLNTGSAGPTTNRVLSRTMAAWRQMEQEPVAEAYYDDPGTVATTADEVLGKAAALIGCSADEVLITRGTTDGINTLAASIRMKQGDHVLLCNLEHGGGANGWMHRQRMDGIVIDEIQLPYEEHDPGRIVAAYAAAITPRTKVISVSHIIAPTGLRMPIAEIAALARKRGILCVVDGAQAVGQIAVDVRAIGCDAYATSGHKWLMGPKGTGFAYISKEAASAIEPPQWRHGKQVESDSSGLTPLTIAIGLGQAIEDIHAIGMERVEAYNFALARRVRAGMAAIPQLHVVSPVPGQQATALVSAMLPPSIDAWAFRNRMRQRHNVVIKMGEKRWFNGIRMSPHIFNDEAEVDTALAALRTEVAAWRD